MPRVYKRTAGSRSYAEYTQETLNEGLDKICRKEIRFRKASETFKIPLSTIKLKLKGGHSNHHSKSFGGQQVTDKNLLIMRLFVQSSVSVKTIQKQSSW